MFDSSPVVISAVRSSRAGNNTERRIRGIPKRDGLVNLSKFMDRFKVFFFFLVVRVFLQRELFGVNDGSLG